jgi:hypothetical protein
MLVGVHWLRNNRQVSDNALDEEKDMIMRRPFPFMAAIAALATGQAVSADIEPIRPDQFAKLHEMIRVKPGEQRFWQVPWKLTITEARVQAAREGKPIFVWAGAGGAPIGVC